MNMHECRPRTLFERIRRLLPASALQKVFFHNNAELKAFLTPAKLPKGTNSFASSDIHDHLLYKHIDWGGDLPYHTEIDNALQDYVAPSSLHSTNTDTESPQPQDALVVPRAPPSVLSSTSILNPFFGYPIAFTEADLSSSTPNLRHGRRRKRDLICTLLRLWWQKWKTHLKFSMLILLLVLISWKRSRILDVLRTRRTNKVLAIR